MHELSASLAAERDGHIATRTALADANKALAAAQSQAADLKAAVASSEGRVKELTVQLEAQEAAARKADEAAQRAQNELKAKVRGGRQDDYVV